MLSFPLRFFIALEPCDMRASINTLHALVTTKLSENTRSGATFAICLNHRSTVSSPLRASMSSILCFPYKVTLQGYVRSCRSPITLTLHLLKPRQITSPPSDFVQYYHKNTAYNTRKNLHHIRKEFKH